MKRHAFEQPGRVSRSGFTLVEILIVVVILGILAALVMPQFSNAGKTTRENVLREDLRYLRSQIAIYRAQHGVAPGYPNGDTSQAATEAAFSAQLTQPTNEQGATGPINDVDYPYGPYLRRLPENPMNGLSTVRIVDSGAFPSDAAGTHGWVYQPTTQRFAADATGADDDGVDYFDY